MKINDQISPYYPVFLSIRGKRCVVVGGGQVALRKVRTLLEHKGSVDVISPDLCSELSDLAREGEIHVIRRHYQPGDLQGSLIAIAATDNNDTNLEVAREARKRAVLVNVVDDAENSDFIAPSYLRRGDVTIAISTAGRSPALARKIRTRLESDFTDEYATLALLINEVRAEVKQQGIRINGDAWQEALELEPLIELLRSGDSEKARTILLESLKTRQESVL
jgi:siroheme synthase-like protein